MVANSKPDVIEPNQTALGTLVDPFAPNEFIVKFLHENPGRPLIVDYLNIMIGGTFGVRDPLGLCNALVKLHPHVPIIIVTKKVEHWPNIDADVASAITFIHPNVLIIVCDARGAKSKVQSSSSGSAKRKSDLTLAQADDHIICLLTLAISASGCGPELITEDWYRDSPNVFKTIPSYEYGVYNTGLASGGWIDSERCFDWIFRIASIRGRHKCEYAAGGRCKSCSMKWVCRCVKCHVCDHCTMQLRAFATCVPAVPEQNTVT